MPNLKTVHQIEYAQSRSTRYPSALSVASVMASIVFLGIAAFVQLPDFAYSFRDQAVWRACRYYGWLAALPPLLLITMGIFVRRNSVANVVALLTTAAAIIWWAQPILFK